MLLSPFLSLSPEMNKYPMHTTLKPCWLRSVQIAFLLIVGSLVSVACQPKPSEAEVKANEERWKTYQDAQQKGASKMMADFEKRQAQLAEKKKAAEKKTEAKATPAPVDAGKK